MHTSPIELAQAKIYMFKNYSLLDLSKERKKEKNAWCIDNKLDGLRLGLLYQPNIL